MYATRRLSMYKQNPGNLSTPPRSSDSGYMVIKDTDSDEEVTSCCCRYQSSDVVTMLPLPQNMILTCSDASFSVTEYFLFIPVLHQPLSANRYYAIHAKWRRKGQVCRCSKEEEKTDCGCCGVPTEADPKPFDHRDEYQQMEICSDGHRGFYAKAVAPDGIPPCFLRTKGWTISISGKQDRYELDDAEGLDSSLRERLPEFSIRISDKASAPVIIGKWYCPFMFVKEEGKKLKEQMKESLFYNITLQQYWKEIYSCENDGNKGDTVTVSASVENEASFIDGLEAIKDVASDQNGFVWFKANNRERGRSVKVGICSIMIERMEKIQKEGGWFDGGNKIERVEKLKSHGGWSRFGCYALVESFVFKKMDGSVLLHCEYRHINNIKCKWE